MFKDVCLDHYPYHKVGSATKHWNNYNYTYRQRDEWSKKMVNEFTSKLEEMFKKSNIDEINKSYFKNGINLLESCSIFTLKDFSIYKVTTNVSNKQANMSSMRAKKLNREKSISDPITYDSINDFLKIKEYFLEQQMFNMRPFLSSNSSEFNLPSETLFANCFFSDFYFPENVNYPVPSQQVYVQISPILLNIDFLTLLWMNTLAFSLWREKLIVDEKDKGEKTRTYSFTKNSLHIDTHLEVILPKVNLTIYPVKFDTNVSFRNENFTSRPSGMEVGMAKLVLTNNTIGKTNSCFDEFNTTSEMAYKLSSNLIEKNHNFKHKFSQISTEIRVNNLAPCFKESLQNDSSSLIRDGLGIHSEPIKSENQIVNAKEGLFLKNLNKNALNKDALKDIWMVETDSLWIDMIDKENVPFAQNASFQVYIINVWDFLSKSSILLQQNEEEDILDNSVNGNYLKAFGHLEKIIHIQNKSEFDAKLRKRSNSLSNRSSLIKSKMRSELLCKKIYSNLNVVSRIKNLNLFLNHSQVLFLLRFFDVIENFSNQIKIDTEQILKFKGHCPKKSNPENDKRSRLKSFRLDFFDEDSENEVHEPSVNLALCIDHIQIELLLDDLRKDIQFQPENHKNEELEFQDSLSQSCSKINEKKSNDNFDSTIEEYNVVNQQKDIDLILNYIKFVYGLSTEMLNFPFNFNFAANSKDLSKEQILCSDSGFSTEKSSLTSNLSNKALSGLAKLTNKLSETGEDLMADDNDNISIIMSLAQEDSSSVISENLTEHMKISPTRSLSSASETNSFTSSTGQMNKLDQSKINISSSNLIKLAMTKNQIIQTDSAKTKVKIRLKNLGMYAQTQGENLISLISFDEIKIRDKTSKILDENKYRDIFIKFKKNSNDAESCHGLAEIYAENFKFELDVPTLTALVDLIDDTDDFKTEIKESVAIKAFIHSCGVKLIDDPFKNLVNNSKVLDIFVDCLRFEKSPDNKLLINEIKMKKNTDLDTHSLRLKLTKGLFNETKFIQESKSDFSSIEFRSRQNLKIEPDKFASMVLMLRKEKETNHLLLNDLEKQKQEASYKEKKLSSKIEMVETENQALRNELERYKNLLINNNDTHGFEDDRAKILNERLEIERKQFESLILGSQQENELLKSKLKKTEDYVALLNIERECLMKKISQSKF